MHAGRSFDIAQCNNSYIFPAIGLAVRAVHARRITDEMFMVAATALKDRSPALDDPEVGLVAPESGCLFFIGNPMG